jgi:hypothetical protein
MTELSGFTAMGIGFRFSVGDARLNSNHSIRVRKKPALQPSGIPEAQQKNVDIFWREFYNRS